MGTTHLETGALLRILDISRRMAETRAFGPLLTYVVDQAMQLVGAEHGYVVLLQPDGTFDFRVTRDRHGNPVAQATDQISRSVLGNVIASGEALIVRDAMTDPRFSTSRSVMHLTLRSIMCVPLISYGKAIGAIYVENRSVRGRFKEANLAPLLLFANQATVAIENATLNDDLETRVAARTRELVEANTHLTRSQAELQRQMSELEALHAQLQVLSIRDALTDAYNRRYLDEQMCQLFAQATRYDRPLTMAILDLDGFKQINDLYMHHTGDEVLRTVAQIIQTSIRDADVLARFGGEEFVLLLPETNIADALSICERIRAAIERHDWAGIHMDLQVTVSIGVADNQGQSDPEQQLRLADTRLYQAKQRGKNRVVAV